MNSEGRMLSFCNTAPQHPAKHLHMIDANGYLLNVCMNERLNEWTNEQRKKEMNEKLNECLDV